jgi:hypothetical protein
MFARAYFPGRTGQLLIVPREGDFITRADVAYMHGSPWGSEGFERYGLIYIRGCQEHFSPSAGGAGLVRDIQPLSPQKTLLWCRAPGLFHLSSCIFVRNPESFVTATTSLFDRNFRFGTTVSEVSFLRDFFFSCFSSDM